MNLMKWLRKNNTKVMAVVVVVLMLGFVAGPTLQYFGRMRTGWHGAVAYFADNRKITSNDVMTANQELNILRSLRADILLKMQGLRGILLSELLFTEQRISPALIDNVRRMIRTNQYRVSDKQVGDIYRRSVPVDYYWLLLKNEAQLAGIKVANEQAGKLLASVVPRLFDGSTYSQLIQSLMNQEGIPEEQILETFSKLLAVLQYSHIICSNEDITSSQIMHMASWENETIDVELVRFDSAVFAETLSEPNEDKMVEHFNKYKKFPAGSVSEQNPYGFGYKLPDRVQLEYIVVRLDDISSIITPPTHQEREEYYRKNIDYFKVSVPSDPNDPNSPQTEQTRSYAEVESIIAEALLQNKVNSRAEMILQQARSITEADLENADIEPEKLTSEQFHQLVGDYKTASEQLSDEHKVRVYAGKTGLLSATDFQNDKNLGVLFLKSYGYSPVGLTRIVFAVDELKASELEPFDAPKPRMYENIGPLRDIFGQMTALVRVIKAEPVSEPESINQTYSKSTLIIDPNRQEQNEDVYSAKEEVTEDLKKLAAMDITKSKAEEFIELAAKDGWDSAVDKFNERYGRQAEQDPNDSNVFGLQELTDIRRLSSATLAALEIQNAGAPTSPVLKNERRKQARFVEQLYSLVPPDSNTPGNVPLIMEFKPDMSYFVIKDISVERLNEMEYEYYKTPRLYKEDHIQVQSLSAVHFNPENILKRMKFRWAKAVEKPADANASGQPEDES